MGEEGEEQALLWVCWEGDLGFCMLWDHVGVEVIQDVADVGDEVSTVLDQFVDSGSARGEDAVGNGENL